MRFLGLPPTVAWALLAGTAALVLLLYLLRPAPRRLVVGSGLIWHRVLRQRKRGPARLRWWLSLLLALAIALALAAAFGRPEIAALGGTAEDHVVVIDNSLSMSARRADGRTRLQHAIERAEGVVRGAGTGSRFLVADTIRALPAAGFGSSADALARLRALRIGHGETPAFPAAARTAPAAVAARDAVASPGLPAAAPNPLRAWFVTDGVAALDVPGGVQVVSVFQPAPNAGIVAFEARPLPGDPRRYEVYAEIANAAPDRADVELHVAGIGAGPLIRSLRIEGNASAGVVLDVSAFGEGPLRAELRARTDAFDADNIAYAFLPGKARMRIALVTPGNAELVRMLGLLPGVNLQVLGPERLRELPRFDAAILDRVTPPRPPPVPALLIAPARAPWLAPPEQELTQTTIARWDDTHPLLGGVPLRDVLIDRAAPRQSSRGARTPPLAPVARGPGEEALILASGAGQRLALVNFALEESNFLLHPGFPAFLANAVVWLTHSTQPAAHPLGPVSVPLPGARVLDLDGRELPARELPGATRFDAAQPGVYTVVGGEQRLQLTANLLDLRATRINDSRRPPEPAAAAGAPRIDPALLLLLAAAALMLLEWWAYTRRMTV